MLKCLLNLFCLPQAVRSITSFNSKPVIMKWYSVPLQLPPQQTKVEPAPVASLPLSVSPKLKKALVFHRPERQLSESDDLRLLSPDSDCGGLVSHLRCVACVCVRVCMRVCMRVCVCNSVPVCVVLGSKLYVVPVV